MPDFSILVIEDSFACVAVTGELDLATAPRLAATLAMLTDDVVVDCTDVGFIDSAGFYALDRAHEAATARGTTFEVSGLGHFQTRLAELLAVPYVCSATGDGG